jgi:hypothetical protein
VEVYERLLAWHLSCPTSAQEMAFATPLRLLLGAVIGVLDGSASSLPVCVMVEMSRELVAPAPTALALMDAVVLLVVDAIQQGAALITIATPRAPYAIVQIQSDMPPSESVRDAVQARLHAVGNCAIAWDGNAWDTHLEARTVAALVTT